MTIATQKALMMDSPDYDLPQLREADFECPHCHDKWEWDAEENAWLCQTSPDHWGWSWDHPAVGGYCMHCFWQNASAELLHRYITENRLQGDLLKAFINVDIYVLTEDVIALVDCFYEGHPEGYRDAALAMIVDSRTSLDDFADWCRGNGMEVRAA